MDRREQIRVEFENLVQQERRLTAEVIEKLRVIDELKIYLDLGFTSLFEYLTKGLKYSNASAQRRIDAARLSQVIPEMTKELASGNLNLSQISLISFGVREKEKKGTKLDAATKKALVEKVKSQTGFETQRILAKELKIEFRTEEKLSPQSNDTLRLEASFTVEEMEIIERARELLSHSHPGIKLKDLFVLLAKDFVHRKDPRREPMKEKQQSSKCDEDILRRKEKPQHTVTSVPEVVSKPKRKPIPRAVNRQVHQKQQSCAWVHPQTGKPCGSRFQLQTDHKKSVWMGGDNSLDNLQVLCSVHNKMKYEQERGRL